MHELQTIGLGEMRSGVELDAWVGPPGLRVSRVLAQPFPQVGHLLGVCRRMLAPASFEGLIEISSAVRGSVLMAAGLDELDGMGLERDPHDRPAEHPDRTLTHGTQGVRARLGALSHGLPDPAGGSPDP